MTICKEEDCKTQAIYNYKGLKSRYCLTHKKDDMVNVADKKCITCNKHQPYFNLPELKPVYCTNCKKDGMIDVKNKKCITCKTKQPVFRSVCNSLFSKTVKHCVNRHFS